MTAVGTVAVIGTGVIGASWAACFLQHGMDVVATDPAPDAEAALRQRRRCVLARAGIARPRCRAHRRIACASSSPPPPPLRRPASCRRTGRSALDLKRALFRELDAASAPETVIASSSSTLMPSEIATLCARPERIVVGHPFNPPHLIPLVEVVADPRRAGDAAERAMAFYRACGKRPIRLRREIRGHVANRLQAALWQEAFHLVREGVADLADVDAAIAHGPGLRWALLGPFLNLRSLRRRRRHGALLRHLGPPTEAMWRDLGTVVARTPR